MRRSLPDPLARDHIIVKRRCGKNHNLRERIDPLLRYLQLVPDSGLQKAPDQGAFESPRSKNPCLRLAKLLPWLNCQNMANSSSCS